MSVEGKRRRKELGRFRWKVQVGKQPPQLSANHLIYTTRKEFP